MSTERITVEQLQSQVIIVLQIDISIFPTSREQIITRQLCIKHMKFNRLFLCILCIYWLSQFWTIDKTKRNTLLFVLVINIYYV